MTTIIKIYLNDNNTDITLTSESFINDVKCELMLHPKAFVDFLEKNNSKYLILRNAKFNFASTTYSLESNSLKEYILIADSIQLVKFEVID